MGLFDFASNIGHKLFSKEDDAAEKIKQHIEENNPGIDNLKVDYQGGFVTISGDSTDSDAVEKAILMAGNVEGVSKVVTDIDVPVESDDVEYYEIQSGDTLSGIAKKFYGNANEYNRIFEANREVIQDPNKIFVGQKIRIPKS
jgi:nucleoid-associated protein YgaU